MYTYSSAGIGSAPASAVARHAGGGGVDLFYTRGPGSTVLKTTAWQNYKAVEARILWASQQVLQRHQKVKVEERISALEKENAICGLRNKEWRMGGRLGVRTWQP